MNDNKYRCDDCGGTFVVSDVVVRHAPNGTVPCPACGPYNGGKPMTRID